MKENPFEHFEALEQEARSNGNTVWADRLKDDIERMKRIRARISAKFQHQEYKQPRAYLDITFR